MPLAVSAARLLAATTRRRQRSCLRLLAGLALLLGVDYIHRLHRTLTPTFSQRTVIEQTLVVVGVAHCVLDDSGSALGGVIAWGNR